jgi:twinkle protein
MEINGFTVDKFNQHGLDDKHKMSICPLCSSTRKKKLEKCATLHWDTGIGVCHHCGESFQLHTYKKKIETRVYKRPERYNNTNLSDPVVKWFEGRGISQFTLRMMKVGEGVESMPIKGKWLNRNTIQFNYFQNGDITNIKYRDGEKNFKLYKDSKLIFYNLDSISISEECVIVEGEIDALSFWEAGINTVVSTPNGSTLKSVNLDYLDNCIEWFDNKKKIYLALDNDEAGRNVTKELVRRLGQERCFIVDLLDCKDSNEYLIKYGKESLANTLKIAKEIPIDGVSSILDWENDYDSYLLKGMNSGYKCDKKAFDNIFSTYTGQYIVVTGIPSSGKSDWVDEMVIGYNKNLGWKTAFASPENKPNVIHAGKIEAKLCGQWIKSAEQVNSLWHKKAKEFIDDNFKFIDLDTYDLDDVLAKAKLMIRKYGIKCLVIDPYNKVRLKRSLNKNINEYTNDYLITIDEFARQNDILIILVAHPRKPGTTETNGYEPSFYDIKGGGEFYDMSPHGLLVHRDYENDMVKIKVLKVKFSHLGKNNAHVWYAWNKQSGRYTEYSNQADKAESTSMPQEDNTNWISEPENTAVQNVLDIEIKPNYSFYEPVYEPKEGMPF